MTDTFDQIREHLEAIQDEPNDDTAVYRHAVAALAKFDALLAEGRTLYIHPAAREGVTTSFTAFGIDPSPYGHKDFAPCLVIPLLVGVGCGNAKKDTPEQEAMKCRICDGSAQCEAVVHVQGCFADTSRGAS